MIKLTLSDKLIVLLSIIMLSILYPLTWSNSLDTRYAIVHVEGEKRYILDLLEDKVLEIEGKNGQSKLEVSQGKVRFIQSPCNSQFCIRSRWLNSAVGIIACLPNGISLQFLNRSKEYDSINF